MLTPACHPPFALQWGFSTKQDPVEALPIQRIKQVHGTCIHHVDNIPPPFPLPEGDGLWTDTTGCLIGVRVADCVPILLAGETDKGKPWVAALHAGWRGATAGIFRQGVALFKAQGGRPDALYYAFGPAIQACCFEVGPEVIAAAQADPAWTDDLASHHCNGKYHLDLHAFLQAQARHMGLDPSKDGSLPHCTHCEKDLLHSYRRGETTGRQWGWAVILP